ncbi:MAG: hypothetical protein V2A71_08250 [Candidatus Eisenbacteria bacterium]
MYIRKTIKVHKGKTYTNYLLVESVQTPKGPRQRIICSLGSLSPGPREHWRALAHKIEAGVRGQGSLEPAGAEVESLIEKVRGRRKATPSAEPVAAVATDRVAIEEAREAGPVHVGHQMWQQLGLDRILSAAGLSDRARTLSELMTLNRLIFPLSEHAMPDWIRRTAIGDILHTDFSMLNDEFSTATWTSSIRTATGSRRSWPNGKRLSSISTIPCTCTT